MTLKNSPRIREGRNIMSGSKKKHSAVEPKSGEQYITMNEGLSGEYKVKVLQRQPKGWTPIKGAMTAPRGYIWVSNNKSLFGGERKTALIKDKEYHKKFPTEVEQPKVLGAVVSKANKTANKKKRRMADTQARINQRAQESIKTQTTCTCTGSKVKSNAVEVVGFNEALKRSEARQIVKRLNKNALDRRIKELEGAGVPKDIAKVMAQTERDYNLRPTTTRGARKNETFKKKY